MCGRAGGRAGAWPQDRISSWAWGGRSEWSLSVPERRACVLCAMRQVCRKRPTKAAASDASDDDVVEVMEAPAAIAGNRARRAAAAPKSYKLQSDSEDEDEEEEEEEDASDASDDDE